MKNKTQFFSILILVFSSFALFAEDNDLIELAITPVEGLVPSFYENDYDSMKFLVNDPFDYVISNYDNPTVATPTPALKQADDAIFVSSERNQSWITGDIWDYEYANQAVFDIEIPDGYSLKYVDIWAADNGLEDRRSDLYITLNNEAASSISHQFKCVSSEYRCFNRVVMTEQGFTDNLTSTATRLCVKHGTKYTFLHLAEIRVVIEPNPNSWTDKPVLADMNTGDLDEVSDLTVSHSGQSTATLYLVPAATTATPIEIMKNYVDKFTADMDSVYRRATSNIALGEYVWYALDLANNLSDASPVIKFIADVNPPQIECTDDTTLIKTSWLEVLGNERSIAYLVKKTTAKTVSAIKGASQAQVGLADDGIYHDLSTYKASAGTYVIYAIDSSDNISDASGDIILESMSKPDKDVYQITGAIGGRAHYDGGRLGSVEYLYSDPFAYDPESPNNESPIQLNANDTAGFFPKAGEEDSWFTIYYDVPTDQAIEFIDLWGRAASNPVRQENLVITLTDTINNVSWSSKVWSDLTTKDETPQSYGRFYFSTANVQPASLLKTANAVTVRHNAGNQEFLSFFEVRVGGPVWQNTAPVADPGQAITVESGDLVTLDASASYDPDLSQTLAYTWLSPITLSDATAMNPTFTAPTVTESTDYNLILRVSDGIAQARPATLVVTVVPEGTLAINNSEISGFNVYPNPSNGVFNLDLTNASVSSQIVVTDLTGKVLYTQSAMAGSIHSIDVSELTQGICVLQVVSGDNTMVQRLIVK